MEPGRDPVAAHGWSRPDSRARADCDDPSPARLSSQARPANRGFRAHRSGRLPDLLLRCPATDAGGDGPAHPVLGSGLARRARVGAHPASTLPPHSRGLGSRDRGPRARRRHCRGKLRPARHPARLGGSRLHRRVLSHRREDRRRHPAARASLGRSHHRRTSDGRARGYRLLGVHGSGRRRRTGRRQPSLVRPHRVGDCRGNCRRLRVRGASGIDARFPRRVVRRAHRGSVRAAHCVGCDRRGADRDAGSRGSDDLDGSDPRAFRSRRGREGRES